MRQIGEFEWIGDRIIGIDVALRRIGAFPGGIGAVGHALQPVAIGRGVDLVPAGLVEIQIDHGIAVAISRVAGQCIVNALPDIGGPGISGGGLVGQFRADPFLDPHRIFLDQQFAIVGFVAQRADQIVEIVIITPGRRGDTGIGFALVEQDHLIVFGDALPGQFILHEFEPRNQRIVARAAGGVPAAIGEFAVDAVGGYRFLHHKNRLAGVFGPEFLREQHFGAEIFRRQHPVGIGIDSGAVRIEGETAGGNIAVDNEHVVGRNRADHVFRAGIGGIGLANADDHQRLIKICHQNFPDFGPATSGIQIRNMGLLSIFGHTARRRKTAQVSLLFPCWRRLPQGGTGPLSLFATLLSYDMFSPDFPPLAT